MMSGLMEKSPNAVLGSTKSDMEEALSNLSSVGISATNTMDEFWEECQRLMADLKAAEGATEAIGEVPRGWVNERQERSTGSIGGGTYADQVKKAMPPVHAAVIVRGEMQKQRVRLVKAAGLEGDRMAELTEKQLVEKVNITLDLMGLQAEDKPEGTRFVGVSKLNGAGGVMYRDLHGFGDPCGLMGMGHTSGTCDPCLPITRSRLLILLTTDLHKIVLTTY
jgi:hypothetical protein